MIVIIIPVFNEGSHIRQVLASLIKDGYTHIVVVDDGSKDSVETLIADFSVTCLSHKANLGQGAALQTGFEFAKIKGAEIVISFDADGQHNSGDIATLIKPIMNNEADMVFGSRFLLSGQTNVPVVRRFVLQLARFVNLFFSGLLLSDAHNGLRAFNKKALFSMQLTENRMAHASEILFEVKRNKLRYKEVQVNIQYSEQSRQKGQSSLDALKILFDIVLHKLFE